MSEPAMAESEEPPFAIDSSFLETVQDPIDDDAPTGEDVLYGEEFQRLKVQIDEIGSASGEADYELIVELAQTVLTEQSKDLRAAGYLVIGAARVNGAPGMAEAIQSIWLMVDRYWEALYPDGARARGGALQFVADRLPDWLQSVSFEKDDRPPLVEAKERLEDLQSFSMQELEEHAPALSGVISDLEDVIDDLPEPEPEPDPASGSDSEQPEAGSDETASDDGDAPDASAAETEEEKGEAEEQIELSPFLEAVQDPIDDDAPTGEDVLYGEEFQRLKVQIDAIGSASGEADYELIVELAQTVLTEQSKDLRAAGYLVIGAARVNGAPGVAEAIQSIWLMVDRYWDALYPEGARSRGGALQFVADRLPDWLQVTSFEPEDRAPLVEAKEQLEDLQSFSMQELEEHAPSLSGVISDLEDAIDELPEPEPEPEPDPEPDPEPEPQPEPESASASDPDPEPDSDQSATTSSGSTEASTSTGGGTGTAPTEVAAETDAVRAVRAAAEYYREQDLSNPTPYRLLRTIRWGKLRSEPPNDGGTTRFEAPREQRRTYLEGLLEDDEYETLVREAESSFQGRDFHVWLDLQRLVAVALEALGPSYEEARVAVMMSVAGLIRRVPSLPSLSFENGVAFASPVTVDWIEDEVKPLASGEGGGEGAPAASDDIAPIVDDHKEARNELSSGNLEEALSILEEGAAQDTSSKEAFHRQLYTASLCVKAEKPQVARPLLDELAEAIDTYTLDAWDPALALEVWTSRCRCYDQLAEEATEEEATALREEAEASFAKICQIDSAHAVSMAERR